MGFMYILLCANGTYYTGSTKYLKDRIKQHQEGLGANYTSKHWPVEFVYYESFYNISRAFRREKQVQNWSHEKKKALIDGDVELLKRLSSSAPRQAR